MTTSYSSTLDAETLKARINKRKVITTIDLFMGILLPASTNQTLCLSVEEKTIKRRPAGVSSRVGIAKETPILDSPLISVKRRGGVDILLVLNKPETSSVDCHTSKGASFETFSTLESGIIHRSNNAWMSTGFDMLCSASMRNILAF